MALILLTCNILNSSVILYRCASHISFSLFVPAGFSFNDSSTQRSLETINGDSLSACIGLLFSEGNPAVGYPLCDNSAVSHPWCDNPAITYPWCDQYPGCENFHGLLLTPTPGLREPNPPHMSDAGPSRSLKPSQLQIRMSLPDAHERSRHLAQPICVVSPARIFCADPTCDKTFKRRADMLRHRAQIHNASSTKLDCDSPGCARRGSRGFVRKDKLRDHQRAAHKKRM